MGVTTEFRPEESVILASACP
uniref:Uncharacterized protein n=1 Tax=Anguilla anguilla TaxID=7936 RepID=A0A0E9V7A0_ANGAN